MRKEPEFRRAIVNHIFPFIASAVQIKPQKLTPATQALRLGLLAGQALEQSDNPATIRHNVQPHRVGLSKYPWIRLLSMDYIAFCRLAGNAYLCIRKGEERSWLNYSPIKSIPQ